MTQEEILENNKLIGKFLGAKFIDDDSKMFPEGYYIISNFKHSDFPYDPYDWEFHNNWNWLMDVVAKCTEIGYSGNIDFEDKVYIKWEELFGNNLSGAFLGNHIDEVYLAVVEFIKWYNKNKENVTQ